MHIRATHDLGAADDSFSDVPGAWCDARAEPGIPAAPGPFDGRLANDASRRRVVQGSTRGSGCEQRPDGAGAHRRESQRWGPGRRL